MLRGGRWGEEGCLEFVFIEDGYPQAGRIFSE
jgi:hypothetical protein